MFPFQQGQAGSGSGIQRNTREMIFIMLSKSQMGMWGLLLFSVVVRLSSVFVQWLTHVCTQMFIEGMNELGWCDEPLTHSICTNSDKK